MTTKITQRFSKVQRLKDPLLATDKIVVAQKNGTTMKTVDTTVAEHTAVLKTEALADGVGSVVNVGFGLLGKGTPADPLKLDTDWLEQTLVRRNRLNLTTVGDRNTRYLPISRTKLYSTEFINSSTSPCLPTATVETTGELKYIHPGNPGAYTASIGRWCSDQNVESLQLIERAIIPPEGLPAGKRIVGITGATETAAILVLRGTNDNTADEYWIADLTDGSLNEDSFTNLGYLGRYTGDVVGDWFTGNSVAAFKVASGRYILSVVRSTNPNAPCTIICRKITGVGTATTGAYISTWNVNSYCGLFSAQSNLRVSDKFIGTAAEKCELVNTGDITASFLGGSNQPTQIQVIQNRNSLEKLYLLVRREFKLTSTGSGATTKYVSDMVFNLSISNAGVGAATAISRYLTNKPTVDSTLTFKNLRETFVNQPGSLSSELITILSDGSVLLIGDKANAASNGEYALYKSPAQSTNVSVIDLHAIKTGGKHLPKQLFSPKPQYSLTAAPQYRLYIASPISVFMNSMDFKIPAQVLDLTSVINGQTSFKMADIPYAGGEFINTTVKSAYLYAQQSGSLGSFVVTPRPTAETVNNTLVAAVFFPTSGAAAILYGQAFSRMSKYRLSYEPQGTAAPVSYDNPGELPKEYWLQQSMAGGAIPTFWKDILTTLPATYAINGQRLYIRTVPAASEMNREFRMYFNGIDLGVQKYVGVPLVWSTVVSSLNFIPTEYLAAMYETFGNTEVSRNYILSTMVPFGVNVVTEDEGDVTVSQLWKGFDYWVRILPYDLTIGQTINVTTSGASVQNLGTQTYEGFPMYFPFTPNATGTYTVGSKVTQTGSQGAPCIVTSVPPIYEYTTGNHTINVPAGRSITVLMVAPGGSGGGAIHNYSSSNYWASNLGFNGGNATLSYLTNKLIAGGGGGGIGANWGNGSSYSNGQGGLGGVNDVTAKGVFTVTENKPGVKPPIGSRWSRQVGGASQASDAPATMNGAGGLGANGVGDEQWSYGGGGGSGGVIRATFKNTTANPVNLSLVIGPPGPPWLPTSATRGNASEPGIAGFCRVTYS